MKTNEQSKPPPFGAEWLREKALLLLVAACLLAPSIWMLAKVPPLWRDADAYHQLVSPPARAAAGGHGLLYCVAVRLPLYLGDKIERRTSVAEPATENFFQQPRLTDTGIFLLIAAQHLALAAAAFFLIFSVTARAWLRIALAVFFASNSLFYTFAQCVGSESLSLICLLLLAAVGWRLIKSERPGKRLWFLFALTLFASLLTRHANVLLIFVLPFALLCSAGRRPHVMKWAAVALAVGLACFGGARLTSNLYCRANGYRTFSKIGFTFLWRYRFLLEVPEPSRTQLLDHVAARVKSSDARVLISVLREIAAEGGELGSSSIQARLRDRLALPRSRGNARRVHRALNEVASAFLLPPSREHWQAARQDLAAACRLPLSSVSNFLFRTTAYYFDHPADLEQSAPLLTFRAYTRESLEKIHAERGYFLLWNFLTLNHCLIVFSAGTVTLLVVGRKGRPQLVIATAYGIALILAALAMLAATALIGELIPRYTLPLWEMIWISLIIYAGTFFDRTAKERPAGQRTQVKTPGGPSFPLTRTSPLGEARESS